MTAEIPTLPDAFDRGWIAGYNTAVAQSDTLGYTVVVTRGGRTEVVGSVHDLREAAEGHLAYCQGMAERRGDDGIYRIVRVVGDDAEVTA